MVEMRTLEPIIKEHRFFKDLKQEYLDIIVGCGANVRFKAGDIIFKEGQEANNFYLIREGLVAVDVPVGHHNAITIQTMSGGDILGWSWLIPPHQARFNCRASQDTRAIAFDGACLRGKCEQNHDLGYELLMRLTTVVTKRLEATRLQLINLHDKNVKPVG